MEKTADLCLTRSQLTFLDLLLANSEEMTICAMRPDDYTAVKEQVEQAVATVIGREA